MIRAFSEVLGSGQRQRPFAKAPGSEFPALELNLRLETLTTISKPE